MQTSSTRDIDVDDIFSLVRELPSSLPSSLSLEEGAVAGDLGREISFQLHSIVGVETKDS